MNPVVKEFIAFSISVAIVIALTHVSAPIAWVVSVLYVAMLGATTGALAIDATDYLALESGSETTEVP